MSLTNTKITVIILLTLSLNAELFAQNGTVTIDQDDAITKLLDYKKDAKTADLYKIQLDFGSRSEVIELHEKFQNTFSKWPSELVYETPNYKIWVGNFNTRLEADIALLEIKKTFSKAMVFEPKKDD